VSGQIVFTVLLKDIRRSTGPIGSMAVFIFGYSASFKRISVQRMPVVIASRLRFPPLLL
jgi:hypothetical protein